MTVIDSCRLDETAHRSVDDRVAAATPSGSASARFSVANHYSPVGAETVAEWLEDGEVLSPY